MITTWIITLILVTILAYKIYRDLNRRNREHMTPEQINEYRDFAAYWRNIDPDFAVIMEAWPDLTRWQVYRFMWKLQSRKKLREILEKFHL